MEKAELLRDADANLLPALLRLQELVRRFSSLSYLSSEAASYCCAAWMMKEEWKSFVKDDLVLEFEIFHNVVWKKQWELFHAF